MARVSGLAVGLATQAPLHFLLPSSGLFQKKLRICELPHVGVATDMRALFAPSSTRRRGEANARRDDGNGRCGRDWPDLVGRGDVQVGACAERGNEVGRGYPPRNFLGRLKNAGPRPCLCKSH